jgi:tRNA U34 5-carboxymethylaminomethyl modifying GTPase MnmE/TrmE
MKKAGIFNIGVSLNGATAGSHDFFVKQEGAFNKAIKTIDLARELGICTSIAVVPTHQNLASGEYKKLIEFAVAKKIRVNVNYPSLTGKFTACYAELLTKKELEEVRKHRTLYREKRRRSGIPIVALVGYTNTGKSTLLNALSQANVLTENKLFATLDPTTKRLTLPDMSTVLLTDTVGFIRKLPPTLVEAFRATLEEISEATVLLHIVDLTSHNAAEQSQVVEGILKDLGLEGKPRITALNKIDLLLDKNESWDETKALEYLNHLAGDKPNTVLISAGKKWGFKKLLETLNKVVNEQTVSSVWHSS